MDFSYTCFWLIADIGEAGLNPATPTRERALSRVLGEETGERLVEGVGLLEIGDKGGADGPGGKSGGPPVGLQAGVDQGDDLIDNVGLHALLRR